QREQPFGLTRGQSGGRLIEGQNAAGRPMMQGPYDCRHRLLRRAECGQRKQRLHFDAVLGEYLLGRPSLTTVRQPPSAGVGLAECELVGEVKLPNRGGRLVDETEPDLVCGGVRSQLKRHSVAKTDGPRLRLVVTSQDLDQRRLTRPVLPQE